MQRRVSILKIFEVSLPRDAIKYGVHELSNVGVTHRGLAQLAVLPRHVDQQGVEVVGEAHAHAAHHQAGVIQEQSGTRRVRKEKPWP